MLRSPELAGEAGRLVSEDCLAAEWAVTRALEHIREIFSHIDDPYFRERGGDFEVVGERLLRILLGLPELRPGADAPRGAVAVSSDVSALDPYHLNRVGIVGLVSEHGGPTSHSAILARAFRLPYVSGVTDVSSRVRPGMTIVVDGTRGQVILDPDEDVLRLYQQRIATFHERETQQLATRDQVSVTLDGTPIHIAANVESVAGVSAAVAAGAESIGLLRTEFLYLDRPDLPSEQEQYDDAVAALHAAQGLLVTFRALDIGGDKLPLTVKMAAGANPALGVRSVRFLLRRPDVLRSQLRALYRASSVAPIRLMFPLVSGVTELKQLRAACDEVRNELDHDHIGYDPATALGIMIEMPSAALTVDHLARGCDFLSVGTNDLIQYTFAADRGNDEVAYLYQPLHPAILRTLKSVADFAKTAETPVAICGDMAGDPFLTWVLIGLGYRELSMDPDRIPLVKEVVRGATLAEAETLAADVLELESEVEIIALVRAKLGDRFAAVLEGFLPR
jgi:phosphotransferase system enzyme I (PtsI)